MHYAAYYRVLHSDEQINNLITELFKIKLSKGKVKDIFLKQISKQKDP